MSGAAAAIVAQRIREKAKIIAAAALEVSADDLEWDLGRWQVQGDPERGHTIAEIAMLTHGNLELPEGVEGHLDASVVYNPPNLTYPYGAYICVTDVDPGTGVVKVRRFIAVDDCGPRINPMIVEGQVHGGLADGIGMALMQLIAFDEDGTCVSGSFMEYLLPTALECPSWELGETVTPSPHHPLGLKGVGESATVGSPAAVVNSVIDAISTYGVRHADMPLTPANVWMAMQGTPGAHRPGRHVRRCAAGRRVRVSRPDLRGAGDAAAGAAAAVRPGPRGARDEPTSAKPGDEAIIHSDGSIEGFVGGTCAESTVRAQSLALLESREPVLLRITPDADGAVGDDRARHADGAQPVPVGRHAGDLPRARGAARRWCWCTARDRSPTPCGILGGGMSYRVDRLRRGPARQSAEAVVLAAHGRDEIAVLDGALDAERALRRRWSRVAVAATRVLAELAGTRPDLHAGRPGAHARPAWTSAREPLPRSRSRFSREIVSGAGAPTGREHPPGSRR